MVSGAFLIGLSTGLAASGAAGAVAGAYAYRRFVLLERRARAAERMAELGALTGGLAHEIKNPLSTIQLNLQLLGEDLDGRDPQQRRVLHRLQTVQRETGRLRETLDDFLKYAGKMEVDRRPTDLHALLEELADFFAPQAQLNRVRVRVTPAAADPALADVDPKLVQQAVLNLMLNAVQAMGPRGGGELTVTAGRDAAGRPTVDVTDTAGGIPPDVLPHIFDAYFSTKKGGTGLGLAISRRIAREHGGDLTGVSEAGRGTDFRLTLPAGAGRVSGSPRPT